MTEKEKELLRQAIDKAYAAYEKERDKVNTEKKKNLKDKVLAFEYYNDKMKLLREIKAEQAE